MKIKDIMSLNVVAVDEHTSFDDAKRIMKAHKIRRLPVLRRNKLVGLVTERRLLETGPSPATSLSVHELNYLLEKMTVKEIMVKNPTTISPDMAVMDAVELGEKMGYGCFPVVEGGRLVGIVTECDIVKLTTHILAYEERAAA